MDFMTLVTFICFPALVWSHARLMSPPSRSSMWRLGFDTKKNFNDNALYCGGISIQWQKNGGKCGICGDPYNMPHPRDNEAGGKYGRGIISKRYLSGQVMQATVEVTTNHRGYFEFQLCPNNNPKKEATQECLDRHVLKEAHGTGTRYYIGDKGNGDISVKLQLPKNLTCSQCVFQWTYVAGNNWGKCEDGESGLGCGPQETFRGCADIAIHRNSDIFDVKSNENDVDNDDHPVHLHKSKNRFHPKETTNTKHVVYTYEVTKESRQKINRTNFKKNHEKSHNHDHSDHSNPDHEHHPNHNHSYNPNHNHSYHPSHDQSHGFNNDHRKFNHKSGDFLPPSFDQHGNSNVKRPVLNGHRDYGVGNRRQYHKYDNRHFYLHDKSFHSNSIGKAFSINNNGPPIGIGHAHPKTRHVYINPNIRRSRIF